MAITKRDVIIAAGAFGTGVLWLACKEIQLCNSGEMYMQTKSNSGELKDYGKILFDPSQANTNEGETSS